MYLCRALTMASRKTFLLFLSLLLLPLILECFLLEALVINSSDGDINTRAVCTEMERKALLKFTGGLEDPSGRLSSWVGGDCCKWQGVDCSNGTGHVIKLDLRNPYQSNSTLDYEADEAAFHLSSLVGQISHSLLDLKYLNYLDLSSNDFQGNPIPNFFGSFERLSYLNLSQAAFSGMIPPHLGNLSNLRQLDISASPFDESSWVSDLNWLSGLSSLKYLNLGLVNLNKAQTNWLEAVNMFPSLLELHLPGCELNNFPQSLSFVNFTSLSVLNLDDNNFEASIPGCLFNASTLVELRLGSAQIKGPIPYDAWGNLCSLEVLDLSGNDISDAGIEFVDSLSTCSNSSLKELFLGQNQFNGHFPDSFGYLKNLRLIDVFDNRLSGQIPNSLGHLKNIRSINLSKNELSGPIPDSIGNLGNLRSLLLSDNAISGSIPPSIGKLLFLEELDLSHNGMNGTIPESIGQLKELLALTLDWNSWKGTVSEIHFMGLMKLEYFSSYLSPATNNSLVFDITSDWIPPFSLKLIRIGNCILSQTFPAWLGTQKELSHIILRNVGTEIFGSGAKATHSGLPRIRTQD
ncbi:hypothetical protein VitviT2T_001436 [Vitis vinifera]|uniref:Leucine-rich repeat-containing N-terminal plant-type domain-containing protein n=2 Tax=Vitis vinifera TaxID=29760 RepID=A0ABY9BFS8_VITVI|nr:hypothetical protein VitviT2T_001436 [Vitis vinifera]|eukprot:XP_019077500.1 PREDICTED: receptor-like protein kinase [Vitis vinifera]